MASRTKQTKKASRKSSIPPVTVEPECMVEFMFTDEVSQQPETVRCLAHRVVDMLAEAGQYKHLSEAVGVIISWLVDGFVIDRVTAMIEEARAAAKEAPRG